MSYNTACKFKEANDMEAAAEILQGHNGMRGYLKNSLCKQPLMPNLKS